MSIKVPRAMYKVYNALAAPAYDARTMAGAVRALVLFIVSSYPVSPVTHGNRTYKRKNEWHPTENTHNIACLEGFNFRPVNTNKESYRRYVLHY